VPACSRCASPASVASNVHMACTASMTAIHPVSGPLPYLASLDVWLDDGGVVGVAWATDLGGEHRAQGQVEWCVR
jgi:hypothetical protein